MSTSSARFLGAVTVALTALTAVGCGPPWIIIRQAAPNPLLGQALAVEPVRYEGLMVGEKPEAVYQAEKDAQQQQSWQIDKAETAQNLMGELMGRLAGLRVGPAPGPAGAFIVRPNVVFIEPGFYVGVAARSTEVAMVLSILDPKGAPVDEIRIKVAVPANLYNPASGGRMRTAGHALGKIAARYLQERLGAP